MSRRGLHTQKIKAQNVAYGPHVSTAVSNWEFKEIESGFALDDSERASSTPFTTKSWIKVENPTPLNDGDDEAVSFGSLVPEIAPIPADSGTELTASDIRGAVGGEAIPGIASESAPIEPNAADASLAKCAEPYLEPSVESSMEPVGPVKDENVPSEPTKAEAGSAVDGDGDVIMS